jgi:hypothetical protein
MARYIQKIRCCVRLILSLVALGTLTLPSAFAQASSANNVDSSLTRSAWQRLNVNPVTGLASASESDYSPLTGDERWELYLKQNYASWGAYVGSFWSALVFDQSTGNPKEYGGGFPGYGRRVASRFGSAVIQGSFQAPVAALLQEDVRYITSNQHGFKRRARHAVLYSFLTYNNQGQPTPNIGNLGGYYAASAASTLWLPVHSNVATYALSDGSQQAGVSVLVNLLQEFWPEIRHSVLHRL